MDIGAGFIERNHGAGEMATLYVRFSSGNTLRARHASGEK